MGHNTCSQTRQYHWTGSQTVNSYYKHRAHTPINPSGNLNPVTCQDILLGKVHGEKQAFRVKTRRGVSGPKMDLLCEPDM